MSFYKKNNELVGWTQLGCLTRYFQHAQSFAVILVSHNVFLVISFDSVTYKGLKGDVRAKSWPFWKVSSAPMTVNIYAYRVIMTMITEYGKT